ncbi:MAG: NAD(P)-dependent oxidoreductase [Candidatus Vogelbacteria bacterium]|nr:NAD(P)-dependent oxidoreductase [Candidatus Vogelbacteria bacterium]
MKILITGAAGYIGGMLADQFSLGPEVEEIVCIDKDPITDLLRENKKITWIKNDLSEDGWQKEIENKKIDVAIHCAWQIRDFYIQSRLQKRWNEIGSEKFFDFVFENKIKKLIHFSTVSSYGALSSNRLDRPFIENDPQREDEYRYGVQKKRVEFYLKKKFSGSSKETQVFIVRPTTITGPRERYMMGKQGLLYVLRGTETSKKSGMMNMLRHFLKSMPVASDDWCRQYIHEDDVTDIVGLLAFSKIAEKYEVFNIAPKDIIRANEMAEIFGRKTMRVKPWLVRIIFDLAWDFTWGRIPTSPGGWRFFCFPIPVDGSKITSKYNFEYMYSSKDALTKDEGRYAYAKKAVDSSQ